MDATRTCLEHFIDYAGLFPPAELSMQTALEEYGTICTGSHAWMAGRFIVPASRTAELREALGPGAGAPCALSVVVDADRDPRAWMNSAAARLQAVAELRAEPRVALQVLEAAVPAPAAARDTFDPVIGQFGMLAHNAGVREMLTYIELPRTGAWNALLPGAMAALKRTGFGAKLRCGGIAQSDFPDSSEIAAFVIAATEAEVAFKATAGLHHPVRMRDPGTGLIMHGFLNLFAAVLCARAGDSQAQVQSVLDDEDPAAFALTAAGLGYRGRVFGGEQIAAAREAGLVSYGSCSFEEPVDDLIALGMLASAETPA